MGEDAADIRMPIATVALAIALFVWWVGGLRAVDVPPRQPGQDGVPPAPVKSSVQRTPVTAGKPIAGPGQPGRLDGEWPGFRGTGRDAIVSDGVRLSRDWPAEGPPVLWSVDMGEGYAGAAVRQGCAYVLDYDEVSEADTLRCLSMDDGREVWRNGYPVPVTRNHGMSRTVPAVVDDHVITFGPRCHVACWSAQSGECLWLIDLVRDHDATEPQWYAGQCPLVDGDRVVLAPCGTALLMAVDHRTGDIIWESPNPRSWTMSHVSVMPMEYEGRQSYVYCGSGGVAAVAADDGRLLWDSTEWPVTFATCPSPLMLPGNRVFLCSGYGRSAGSLILKVQYGGNGFTAEVDSKLTPKQFNAEHHTPIFDGQHIYGVRKRGGGQLVCLDLRGNEIWSSGKDRYGHGPYLLADDLILVMDDRGWLSMVEATPDGYRRLGRSEVFPSGHDAWGPMTLVGGRLIVRDMTRMACLDIARK